MASGSKAKHLLDPAGLRQFSFSLRNAASQEQRWDLDLSNSSQSHALATSQPVAPGGCLFMQSSFHGICASRRWEFDDEKGMAVITMGCHQVWRTQVPDATLAVPLCMTLVITDHSGQWATFQRLGSSAHPLVRFFSSVYSGILSLCPGMLGLQAYS